MRALSSFAMPTKILVATLLVVTLVVSAKAVDPKDLKACDRVSAKTRAACVNDNVRAVNTDIEEKIRKTELVALRKEVVALKSRLDALDLSSFVTKKDLTDATSGAVQIGSTIRLKYRHSENLCIRFVGENAAVQTQPNCNPSKSEWKIDNK